MTSFQTDAGEWDIDSMVCVVVTNVFPQDLHRKRCFPHFLPLRTMWLFPQYGQTETDADSDPTILSASESSILAAALESFLMQSISWDLIVFSFMIDLRNTMMIQVWQILCPIKRTLWIIDRIDY